MTCMAFSTSVPYATPIAMLARHVPILEWLTMLLDDASPLGMMMVSLSGVVNVVANDSVPNGLPERAVRIRRGARNGFVRARADSTVQYEPNAGFEGEDSFAYRVEDVFGLLSREADVRVTVSPESGPT